MNIDMQKGEKWTVIEGESTFFKNWFPSKFDCMHLTLLAVRISSLKMQPSLEK